MNTVLLITPDDGFHSHLARTLRYGSELIRWRAIDSAQQSKLDRIQLVIFDLRLIPLSSVRTQLDLARLAKGWDWRAIAITEDVTSVGIEVLRSVDGKVLDVVLLDCDSVADLIDAHINDSSSAASAAIALEVLLRMLPEPTHETFRVVIGGGFRVSSVKELAAAQDRERTSVGKTLRSQTNWTPRAIIDLAQATAGAALLRDTDFSVADVAETVRRGTRRSLEQLLRKIFDMCAQDIRVSDSGLPTTTWLERRLPHVLSRRTPRAKAGSD